MTTIRLSGEFLPAVLEGRKVSTIRRGRRMYPLGDAVLRAANREVMVRVERVRHSVLHNLTEEDALHDGFDNLEELLAALDRFYPELRPEDEVTIVEFARKESRHDKDSRNPGPRAGA